ncbi:integrase catalytic domain-containing protein [Trichonephila clavipes]|nr:integrase catalytic domain-containing protein [Trichonephila clavipes]
MWTDSTITLAWIKTEPHKLKTFVSNRVAEIQALSKDYNWKHVSSKNNPADLISRGCNVDELLKNENVVLGFINNIKAKESCNKEKYLTADEVKRSTEFLAKIAQLSEFKAEIDALKKVKVFQKQGLVHQIRMQFWPINGKGIARKTVHDCIACFRQKPTGVDQLMGNLPSERVTPSAPFLNSGVDFCGPFQIKFKNQRKGIFSKVYVAIFVCLATKAIHLEAVTDLTTEAFIAALKRLCARRGRISTLMSDNATNFKGAAAELNRFIKLICNKNETLANYFASEAIQWKFIPPRSPNFGGLWEAGVKSFKHHLYRTLVNSKITFEEFETIIIQIEGILNSRPLVPLSDNINEYEILTPGHFIIGRPISAIPEPAILDISGNRLSRWQYTTKCVQTIWKRRKNDYLNHLQQRNKWQFEKNNVAVGCLVLLKENDLPPCKWTMARILEVIYGTDGKTSKRHRSVEFPLPEKHGITLSLASIYAKSSTNRQKGKSTFTFLTPPNIKPDASHRGVGGCDSQGIGSWLACHEFEPSTTKDPPCKDAMLIKSVVSSNVFPLVWLFGEVVPAQVSFSSLDLGSKLRGPSPKALV